MPSFLQGDGSSAAVTLTAASLASDTNLVAGRESTFIDNSSARYLDYLVSGFFTTGTSPTAARQIELWCVGTVNDAFLLPDSFTGSDSNRSATSRNVLGAYARAVAVIPTTSTSNVTYWIGPTSVAQLFGGVLPKKFLFWIVHNTAVALNSTSGNHGLHVSPRFVTA